MAYCTRADIETVFGAANVATWADRDETADPVAIAARIAAAITHVTDFVNSYFRGSRYNVPFAEPLPAIMKNAVATLAGVWLYEGRGVEDFDPASGAPGHRLRWSKRDAEATLFAIRSGTLQVDITPIATGTPEVVPGKARTGAADAGVHL